jgi:hypothetical protein
MGEFEEMVGLKFHLVWRGLACFHFLVSYLHLVGSPMTFLSMAS